MVKDCSSDCCGGWREKINEMYPRAMTSINRIVTQDGRSFTADGMGTTQPPLPLPTSQQLAKLDTLGPVDAEISELQTQTAGNTASISSLSGRVDTADSEIDGLQALTQSQGGTIGTHTSEITALKARMSSAESSIVALQGTTAESAAEISELSPAVSEVQADVSALETLTGQHTTQIQTNSNSISSIQGTVSTHETEINGLLTEVISDVAVTSSAHGTVQVVITHEDESETASAPIDLGLIAVGGVQLLSATGDRAFKMKFTQTDGTVWYTNDFVIPAGGGGTADLTVTSVAIAAGTATGTMKITIGFDDGTSLDSNDFAYVAPSDLTSINTSISSLQSSLTALTGRVTTAEGKISTAETEIDSLDSRVTALEDGQGYTLPTASGTVKGGIRIGSGLQMSTDVCSVNTAVIQTVAGMATYATKSEVTAADGDLQDQIDALGVSVSTNLTSDPPTITVQVNGKSSSANLPAGGGGGGGGGGWTLSTDSPSNFVIYNSSEDWVTVSQDLRIVVVHPDADATNFDWYSVEVAAGTFYIGGGFIKIRSSGPYYVRLNSSDYGSAIKVFNDSVEVADQTTDPELPMADYDSYILFTRS